jgi:hypothetical protein
MSGGMESWKLASALFQMMICIGSDGLVLPNQTDKHIFKGLGFHEEGMQDISDIVLSAAAACLEMYFAITSKQLRKGDLPTVQYLVECSVFHHVRLSRLFKSLRLRPNGSKSSSRERTLIEWCDAIGGNKCHLLLQHVVESKEWFGANPRQIDTELSKREHKWYRIDIHASSGVAQSLQSISSDGVRAGTETEDQLRQIGLFGQSEGSLKMHNIRCKLKETTSFAGGVALSEEYITSKEDAGADTSRMANTYIWIFLYLRSGTADARQVIVDICSATAAVRFYSF